MSEENVLTHPDFVHTECPFCEWKSSPVEPDYKNNPNGLWFARSTVIQDFQLHFAQIHRQQPRIVHSMLKEIHE